MGLDHHASLIPQIGINGGLPSWDRDYIAPGADIRDVGGRSRLPHGGYVTFLLVEVAIPRDLFADFLRRNDRLRLKPLPT